MAFRNRIHFHHLTHTLDSSGTFPYDAPMAAAWMLNRVNEKNGLVLENMPAVGNVRPAQ